jgi:phosphotransferase system enzyme I (PtsI)
MGLRSFSMHPSQVASIKQRILRADTTKLSQHLHAVLSSEDPRGASHLLLRSDAHRDFLAA